MLAIATRHSLNRCEYATQGARGFGPRSCAAGIAGIGLATAAAGIDQA